MAAALTPVMPSTQPIHGCRLSPRCQPARTILAGLDLPPETDWRWLHLGPIGPSTTMVAVHRPAILCSAPLQNRGGGVRIRDAGGAFPTWREHTTHPGYRIDLFGTPTRPTVQARYLAPARLWVVYAVAWKRLDGPFAAWASAVDAPCELTYHFPGGAPSAADLSELGRCADLLAGRSARPGRKARYDDTAWQSIAEAAEARKRSQPALTWDAIARAYNVQPRTLRVYRAELRRERDAALAATAGPILVTGGQRH